MIERSIDKAQTLALIQPGSIGTVTQVGRGLSAKQLRVGSIPTRYSNLYVMNDISPPNSQTESWLVRDVTGAEPSVSCKTKKQAEAWVAHLWQWRPASRPIIERIGVDVVREIPQPTSCEFHPKGWGHELWLVNCEKYCGKILYFNKAGNKCSFHYHKLKNEHFYCSAGGFLIKMSWADDLEKSEMIYVFKGNTIEIPIGLRHQMIALYDASELIEISTQHLEDDSYRVAPGDSQKV